MYGPTRGDIIFAVGIFFLAGLVCGVLGHIAWQHVHAHLSVGWQ